MIRVVLVDDQAVIRAGFRILLEENDDITVVGEASGGREAVRVVRATRPDVVCMDLRMSEGDGLTATRQIVSEREGGTPSVLVVTTFDMDADVFGALEAGADGFILKDCEPEELVDAVRRLALGYGLVDQSVTRRVIAEFARRQGKVENREALGVLTEREREVVQLLASGMSNAEIAAELIQQLRRDIADSLHDDLAADLTRMLIISRSIRLPHSDDRDRVLDLQDRTQQALAHLRLLIHNLAVSQGPPKEEPTLQEIVDSSASTLAQREIVLDADLDGIERIPALHRSELGRLLVAFIRENTLNALKYNFPRDLVSLFVEQEQDTLFISFSSPWHDQKVPEEMHGGYGLWALQDRFENAGGSLSSNRIGASWTVLASLPWNEIATPTTNARSLMSPPDGAAYA